MKLAAQILGVLALGENAFIFLSRKRERILQLKLLSDILWMGNYLLLGAYRCGPEWHCHSAGVGLFCRDRRRWADAPWWPVSSPPFPGSPILEWVRQGRITLLPILPTLGGMLFAIALYQRKPLWAKLLSIAGNLLWMIYAGIVGNPSGLLSSGIFWFPPCSVCSGNEPAVKKVNAIILSDAVFLRHRSFLILLLFSISRWHSARRKPDSPGPR